jgi:hypothetical protein
MAARLSEFLAIGSGSAIFTTHITLSSSDATENALRTALSPDWKRLSSLEGLAIHRSMSGDCVVAHCHWGGSAEQAVRGTEFLCTGVREAVKGCSIEQHVLTLDSVRRGSAAGSGNFSLNIDSASGRPVLIAAYEPIERDTLLAYLHEASTCFVQQVPGWHGAALYCDIDGRRVIEYLQFESLEGVAASQESPLIQQHQAALQKLGAMKANLYRVEDVYRRGGGRSQ